MSSSASSSPSTQAFEIAEGLGASYRSCLTDVRLPGAQWARDELSGRVVPLQLAPATALDGDGEGAGTVQLALVDLDPGQRMRLVPAPSPGGASPALPTVIEEAAHLVIANGRLALRVPRDRQLEQPFPGPIAGFRIGDGPFIGESRLIDAAHRGAVATRIEALGPALVQWRTTWRWGSDHELTVVARWAAGSDTIQIVESASRDCAAAVEWLPFGADGARAWTGGGGEGKGPMRPAVSAHLDGSRRGDGRRRLNSLSHISYFNQWNLAWIGFTRAAGTTLPSMDEPFVGVFSGWGERWRRRGHVRPDLIEDDRRGCLLRFPVMRGRRCYGLVLSTGDAVGGPGQRCLLNRRKAVVSDLRLAKVAAWELDPPLEERRLHLLRESDAAAFRGRLARDGDVTRTLDAFLARHHPGHGGVFAATFWKGGADDAQRACARALVEGEARRRDAIADGGYERLIIFDGRAAKSLAYDLDLMWARSLIDEAGYRAARRSLLALAYMFSDPGYCRYEDFGRGRDALDEGMDQAMADDIGDAPVPPNFAAEFFTTTAVVAEAFERHPLHLVWREWGQRQLDAFLAAFCDADGTYHESVNYQTHIFNELMCMLHPLRIKGVRDYFAEPVIAGSYRHLVEIQTPPLAADSGAVTPIDNAGSWHGIRAADPAAARTMLPANGNSGGGGLEQDLNDLVVVGAEAYRERDPLLALALMGLWRRGGKPVLSTDHPLLTLMLLDPAQPEAPPPSASAWRRSLGLVSRATRRDGAPVWSLFRAGSCTHHMDFDQGHVHLAAWGEMLLGDYGYRAKDAAGAGMPVYATWLHSTVVYAEDKHLSSGYTGLERAPEPARVEIGDAFDWCVHRIVNTNHRDTARSSYHVQLPAATTRHVRHWLFVKPDYQLIWDTFEEASSPSTFWLHPRHPMIDLGGGAFRSGVPGRPHLRVQFAMPRAPRVVENQQAGPLWSFAVRNDAGAPYLAVLRPQVEDHPLEVEWNQASRCCRVVGPDFDHRIHLPEPGAIDRLPRIERGAAT